MVGRDMVGRDMELAGPDGPGAAPGLSWVRPAVAPIRAALRSGHGHLASERPRFVNWLPVLFGLGIAAYFALSKEPGLPAALLPLAAAMGLFVLSGRSTLMRVLAGGLIVAGLGFAAAKVRTLWIAAPVLEHRMGKAEIIGLVEHVEPHAKRGARLVLRVVSIAGVEATATPRRARIRVLSGGSDWAPGDRLRLTATLSRPAGPVLPGGFDFGRAAFFQGVGAVGYALTAPVREESPEAAAAGMRLRAAIEGLRRAISARILAALPGERGALAVALITGERGGISAETTAAYRDSGLIHILSISGLHMAIMAGAVFATLRFLIAAVPRLALTVASKKLAAAGGIAGALFYLAISGGAVATLRSAIMMVVFFLAVILGRPAIALRNVALSALLILAVFPESLLDVGFQMSFAAVVALVAAYEALGRHFERIGFQPGVAGRAGLFFAGIVLSTVIAGLAVMPLSIYHFHTTQHFAALANLVAIPVCNLIVMPAALATFVALPFGLEALPLSVMGQGLDVMGAVAARVAALPGSVSTVAAIPGVAFAALIAGGLWLTLWHLRWRVLGVPMALAGLAMAPLAVKPDILIGAEGDVIAVRQASGQLAVLSSRAHDFELKRWLEADGDARAPAVVRRERAFACDGAGCTAAVGALTVALSRHPGGLADDCARADLLIVEGERVLPCLRPRKIYDRAALKASGAVTLTIQSDGSLREETSASARGQRPWSTGASVAGSGRRAPQPRRADNVAPGAWPATASLPTADLTPYLTHGATAERSPVGSRLKQFAAPATLVPSEPDEPVLRAEFETEEP